MNTTEDILTTILAMREQEENAYTTCDYLYQDCCSEQYGIRTASRGPLHEDAVDADCRNKMAAWCFQVIDFCKMSRETVSIAMNFVDRYMVSAEGSAALYDRKLFQLACMSALYTAVKIHEPEAMAPELVASLSRGAYSAKDIEDMESKMLKALKWRVNPPTALAYTRLFIELIPEHAVSKDILQAAYDLAKFQTELAVNEYSFTAVKNSTLAYCSLANSLESLGIPENVVTSITTYLAQSIGLDSMSPVVYKAQEWLYQAVVDQPAEFTSTRPSPVSPKTSGRRGSIEYSPRSTIVR